MNVSEQTIRLYHAVNEVFFFFFMHAEQESVKTVWRLQRRVKFNKAIKTSGFSSYSGSAVVPDMSGFVARARESFIIYLLKLDPVLPQR